jgi:hypothetical protein
MFLLWASFGDTMTGYSIKVCALCLRGGADAGRVAQEGAALVFEDANRGVIAETLMQAPIAIRLVK